MRASILLSALMLASPSAFGELPEPLKSAIANVDGSVDYVFDIERTSTTTGEDGETVVGYARVDPTAPELKQITPMHLVDPASPGSSFQALSGIEGAIEDGIWCSRFGENLPDADKIKIVAEDTDTVTYEYTPAIDEDASGPEKKIGRRLKARLVVARENPAILSLEQSLTKTVTLFVVAKIRKVETTATCERVPDGRTYSVRTTSAFEASGVGDGGNSSEMLITALYDPASGTQVSSGAP